MPRAVRFDEYGDIDVLNVVEVERPVPGRGQVLVAVKAAGINPGAASIRKGLMHERWQATFPSGQGSDLAGVVGVVGRIREVTDDHVDALIDTFGGGYVAMAIEELGVAPERVDTIIDWAAAEQYGAKAEGTAAAADTVVLTELIGSVDRGELEVP